MSRQILAAATLAAALPLLAAEPLAVRAGLWETTTEVVSSGLPQLPAMPAGVLDNLSPEQRAKVEQAMKLLDSSGAPQVHVERSCVTAEDIKEGVFKAARESQGQQCRFDVVSATATRQELKMICPGQLGADGRMVLTVLDDTHVEATMDAKVQVVTMNMKMKGRWIAASCDGANGD